MRRNESRGIMKILVVHNFHRMGSASGDDQVFKSETSLLEEQGNEVLKYTVSNDSFDTAGLAGKILSTFGMLWSFKNSRAIKKILKKEKPDVVHFHTFFPLLSPSVLYAAKKSGCKVVATLHDARLICPCATCLRNAQLCNACTDGRYFRMFKYGCFKGSKLQSLIVAGIFKYHRARKSFYNQIDQYICLNDQQMQLLKNSGFDETKMVKKYNFVPDRKSIQFVGELPPLPERYAVYYGRIGEEKGIRVLQKIWDALQDIPLVVMGGGPLEEEFATWARSRPQVYYLGFLQNEKCLQVVKNASFVVFPSICYEGCSMVAIEAESLGKALVATDLGFSVEAIENGVNGCKVPLYDINGFVEAIRYLWGHPQVAEEMGRNARADYEKKYRPEDNYKQLMEIYRKH